MSQEKGSTTWSTSKHSTAKGSTLNGQVVNRDGLSRWLLQYSIVAPGQIIVFGDCSRLTPYRPESGNRLHRTRKLSKAAEFCIAKNAT